MLRVRESGAPAGTIRATLNMRGHAIIRTGLGEIYCINFLCSGTLRNKPDIRPYVGGFCNLDCLELGVLGQF